MGLHIPQYADDIARIKRRAAIHAGFFKGELPQQDPGTVHHALYDALHEKKVHEYLLRHYGVL